MKIHRLIVIVIFLIWVCGFATAPVVLAGETSPSYTCSLGANDCIELLLIVPCGYPAATATLFGRHQGYVTSKPVRMEILGSLSNNLYYSVAFENLDETDTYVGRVNYLGKDLGPSQEGHPPGLYTWTVADMCHVFVPAVSTAGLAN